MLGTDSVEFHRLESCSARVVYHGDYGTSINDAPVSLRSRNQTHVGCNPRLSTWHIWYPVDFEGIFVVCVAFTDRREPS